MKCSFWGQTDPGLLRTTNQDAYVMGEQEYPFVVVADGMGGHAGGEEASQLASLAMQQELKAAWQDEKISSQELLYRAVLSANEAILGDQIKHPERADMGTTLVAAIFRQRQWWFAHIGDSRLYRIRDRQVKQLTEDHTWVARAVKLGELTNDQARNHPWRHVLMQCLGREECNQIDIYGMDIQQGDWLLLCSDGLTEELTDGAIAQCLEESSGLEDAVTRLVESAKEQGGRDNITVVLMSVDELSPDEVDEVPTPPPLLMEDVLGAEGWPPVLEEGPSDAAGADAVSPYGEGIELVE